MTQKQIMSDSTKRLMRLLKTGRRLVYLEPVGAPVVVAQSAKERWATNGR